MALGLLLVLLFSPLLALAQTNDAVTDRESRRGGSDRGADFCENLDTLEENLLDKLADRANSVKDRGNARGYDVDTRRAERQSEYESRRDSQDSDREDRYESLRDKAETDEQAEAIEDFISTVESLLEDIRAAYDAAIEEFETAVENLKGDLEDTTGDLADELEREIAAIFDEAEDACDSGSSSDEVRTLVREGLSEMKTSRQSNRDEYSYSDELEALRETRKTAFAAAKETFQAGVADAKEELRTAFADSDDDNDDDSDDDGDDS